MPIFDRLTARKGTPEPEAKRYAPGLTSPSASERARALEAARQVETDERDRRIARARTEIEAAERDCARALEAAEQTAEARRLELGRALVERFYEQATPMVTQWMTQPSRGVALELFALVNQYSADAAREVEPAGGYGMSREFSLMLHAFVDCVRPAAPAIVNGTFDSPELGRTRSEFERAVRDSNPLAFEGVIAAIEAAVMREASSRRGQPADARAAARYEITRAAPTTRDTVREIASFDRAEQARRDEATFASLDVSYARLV